MDRQILDYLNTQKICVLAVEMLDGSPHAATLHFAHSENPLVFYFETDKNYRKAEPLFGKEITRASLVIGTDLSNMKTFQLDGEARLIKPEEKAEYDKVYLGKFPEKAQKMTNPNAVHFMFTPTWWRFTDFKHPDGKLILTSTDK